MSSPAISADSLITLDVGTTDTRAHLYDVVNGRYRYIASGIAQTTIMPPFNDLREGIFHALTQLQDITQRTILSNNGRILIPSQADGSGVDAIAVTLSAGPVIKVVAVGLLEDVSLESARNLATSTYASVNETLSINDRRKQDERIDAILRVRSDLIIIAGGIDGGASRSINELLEAVGAACQLMPKSHSPHILYAGNKEIHENVTKILGPLTNLHFAPNIRPTLRIERIESAQTQLVNIFRQIRAQQLYGLTDVESWAEDRLAPGSSAFGRTIQFLSLANKSRNSVLGIDVGASALTLAATNRNDLLLRVYPELGLASQAENLLASISIGSIARWLPFAISHTQIRDYLFNKASHPGSLPSSAEEMYLDQAITKQIMRTALKTITSKLHGRAAQGHSKLVPPFEPIIISGRAITHAPTLAQSLLMTLDGIQPTGITTLVLDQNNIAASLGAAATYNPLITVQVLESNAFLNLGTIISPVGYAQPGVSILRINTTLQDGTETQLDVKNGTLQVIAVPQRQSATLQLQPLHRFDIGMGSPGRGGTVQVTGGAFGVIIDARGRPLTLPQDAKSRGILMKRWLKTLGN
ncbi:MAG: glutamate mutase L [Chloroflexi bacterium]|nr:glutamate mutase L [Chloroflexota bacterium]